MTVMKTKISWTDSTFNPTTGCTKVSAGCINCYAESLTRRLMGLNFDVVRLHPNRLKQVHGFQPIGKGDELRPRMVFVNSMSDLMHADIPDEFRDQVFDALEDPGVRFTIFQVLTKRAMTLRKYIAKRYAHRRVPPNIWLGVSAENDVVRSRIGVLQQLKDIIGEFTAFVSAEPLIGPIVKTSYEEIDWVLIGGESEQNGLDKLQVMDLRYAQQARDKARQAGAAVWFKQFGHWVNNPLYHRAGFHGHKMKHIDRVRWAIEHGEKEASIVKKDGREIVTGEKGGATLDGEVLHELPFSYFAIQDELRDSRRRQQQQLAI